VIKDKLYKALARKFVPAWANDLKTEGIFHHMVGGNIEEVPESEYILVEDNRADVTIFVFSGLDGLFAAGPRFEFKNAFSKLEQECNLVFVRELRGMFYHVAPNGHVDGLAFYERKISEIMKRLGATHNISTGFSVGGTAAFYFGTKCGMDKIIGFGPAFPLTVYNAPMSILRSLCNFRSMFYEFSGYTEVLLVSIWCLLSGHRLKKVLGEKPAWDVMRVYRDAAHARPQATIIYGTYALPDVRQASMMREFDEVRFLAIETGYHNVPGELKKRGQLGPVLLNEVREYLDASDVTQQRAAANA
jgi:hypothetical protein